MSELKMTSYLKIKLSNELTLIIQNHTILKHSIILAKESWRKRMKLSALKLPP